MENQSAHPSLFVRGSFSKKFPKYYIIGIIKMLLNVCEIRLQGMLPQSKSIWNRNWKMKTNKVYNDLNKCDFWS